jgi:hypothetical protein
MLGFKRTTPSEQAWGQKSSVAFWQPLELFGSDGASLASASRSFLKSSLTASRAWPQSAATDSLPTLEE